MDLVAKELLATMQAVCNVVRRLEAWKKCNTVIHTSAEPERVIELILTVTGDMLYLVQQTGACIASELRVHSSPPPRFAVANVSSTQAHCRIS